MHLMAELRSESRIRSILKTISWRITATLTTTLITYMITEKWSFALSVGAIELLLKMFLYYFHERLWNKTNIGIKFATRISQRRAERKEKQSN